MSAHTSEATHYQGSQSINISTTTDFLPVETLHKNQIHLPKDWTWYVNHNKQGFGWVGVKNKTLFTLRDDLDQTLEKG